MSVFWIIRLALIAVLGTMVVVGSYLLRNRKQYQRVLNSWFFNILLVLNYQLFSYLIVILPSAECKVPMLCRIEYQRTQFPYVLVGSLLVCAGILLQIVTAMQRKVIGAQDIRQELMTSGLYRYFRHPIYTGIIWTCLGLAVLLRNPDGLLAMPLIFFINLSQAISEEKNDMIMRFAEKYRPYKQKVRMFGPIWLWIALFFIVLALVGCATTPKLTIEDRKRDIEYLARWARDHSPLVELAEKHKGNPSYEALLPKYLEYAEQAQSNEEFYKVIRGYYDLICSNGHRYLIPESQFKWCKAAMILGIIDLGINPFTSDQALYWSRLAYGNLSTRAHPPFHIAYKDDKYLIGDDWRVDGVTVPQGSQITKVNGMNCTAYLDYIRKNTSLRYDAFPKDWIKKYLLIIDEGEDFTGWQIDFLLRDNSTHSTFVPKIKGFPKPKKKKIRTIEAKENCTCIELTDEVAYIRIKSMSLSQVDLVFPSLNDKDRKIISGFFDRSPGKYKKLIIDIRNNWGGSAYYVYENLIRPFLDEPVTYNQVAGIRRKYRDNLRPSVLKTLRMCSRKQEHVVNTEEIDAPEGFDSREWIFYRLTRRIEPHNRYNFNGDIYVLIDGNTFSAADDYANAVKRIGFAKLVGRNTRGGCAAYIGPPAIRLPVSGMIFRVETEIVINPDGSINELFGTPPDIELPDVDPPQSIAKEDLLKDEWVKKIINEL
jgi:protein-S-isoprenylcysteine O-methyltransferase Ste14/C-terminal processing protease CtpA/Prc